MKGSRALAAIAAIGLVGSIAVMALMAGTRTADACFVQLNPPPVPGLESGPDCRWYLPDGTPYDELLRGGGVPVPWYLLAPASAVLVFLPLLSRAQLQTILRVASRPLSYFVPGAELRR